MSRQETPPRAVRQPPPTNTPSKVGTALRSSAHASGKRPADLKNDIKIDVKKTEKVEFDSFLRFLLSRSLQGTEQSEFEAIQKEIEELQAERFDNKNLRQTPKGHVQGTANVSEVLPPEPRESELVKQRDDLLQHILDQCLSDVLPTANNDNIRAMLTKLSADLIEAKSAETTRYKPFADVYNAILRELAGLKPSFLRQPDFPLCLSRADPRPITTSFFDSDEVTGRKPVFVHTSASAACATHGNNDKGEPEKDIGAKPTSAFTWSQVLSSNEMKAFNIILSSRAKGVKEKSFLFTSPGEQPRIQYTFVPPETPETVQGNSESGAKRRHSQANDGNQSSQKRLRTSTTGTSTPGETDSERNIDARIQLAGYAMEMMSYGPGVVHVVNTLIIDEYLFLWYYDSQGSICSEGISIIADFPRFLVLALAFQRFTIEDWGIVPCLNPQALHGLGIEEHVDLDVAKLAMDGNHFSEISHVSSDIQGPVNIELKKLLSAQSHRLSGRMTTVLKASAVLKDSDGRRVPLACKLSRPEVQRIPEGDVLSTAHAIALDRAAEMCDHLPKLYFSGDLRAGNTLRVRSLLNLNGKGHCTLRALVVNELQPLTTVTGDPFVKAWLDVVTCHAFLWKHGVEHGDPSLPNVMYDPIKGCGVLSDFDLSTMAWLERVPGDDRTGTIPFMALDLLSNSYWMGYRERCHHHELEAFIWILSVVFLAYRNRKRDPKNILTNDWFTSDYIVCAQKKAYFLSSNLRLSRPSRDFKHYHQLMRDTCVLIRSQVFERDNVRDRVVQPYNTEEDSTNDDQENEIGIMQDDTQESKIQYSEAMWEGFISILSDFSSQPNTGDLNVDRLKMHKPTFDISQCQSLFEQMQIIYKRVTQELHQT
ncbi:hypothetical protein D9619_005366 [Psilocybe cf. subviscida]|uniref:Fungal-type protein kinase domain-containing protein n=1 Tax=Psilocybe cf. subviscida TaxID=2480587 RepID=A0A8H5BW49_9AGAR|nr:hypothetical protein D9619_005366 [Psilocybe cf. subviscida]